MKRNRKKSDMEKNFKVYCKNDGKSYGVSLGTTLKEMAGKAGISKVKDEKSGEEYDVLAALVDNKLKELSYCPFDQCVVEFIGYNHPDGRRTYNRSLSFILQKAVREIFPDKVLYIDHSLPSGTYCEIRETAKKEDGRAIAYPVSEEEIDKIKARMRSIVEEDLPFGKVKMSTEEATAVFSAHNQPEKIELLNSLGFCVCSMYELNGDFDTFHGPLVPSTGKIKNFDLIQFRQGFCLQLPLMNDFTKITPMHRQSKIASTLEEYSQWCDIMGIHGVGDLNRAIHEGHAVKLINIAEALHERRYADIADMIYKRRGQVKVVFIAGPSSSGKTSSSLRLALQCMVLGLKPKVIELDNYFVDREHTPKDENGEYDFESLYAMDLDFLNQQLNELIDGKEVEIPKYDFKSGTRTFTGKRMRLGEKDILIMEGIHALDPKMIPNVDQSKVFKVYASALTSLNLDENNDISTSDNRLLRRMVRDNRVRGITPESTIERWNSVRRGEERNIFPYQENADALFNSALIFELPMLKYYAEPLLMRIAPNSPAYTEAVRLLKFLRYIVALQPSEIEAIPPTSIMREFIGGQTL